MIIRHPQPLLWVLIILLSACSPDEPVENQNNHQTPAPQKLPPKAPEKPFIASVENCEPGQVSIESGYHKFLGINCPQIATKVEKTLLTSNRFLNQCKRNTGSKTKPKSVARIQVRDCVPLKKEDGYEAAMLVCCNAPEPEIAPAIISYDTQLNCPDNHLQALATALHYPKQHCASAVIDAASKSSSSHYQRACQSAASGYTQQRQKVLDVDVFTCSEDSGAFVDVAVCCSATLPKGKKMHPLKVPADIWEVLRTNDTFALKLFLSRKPEKFEVRGKQGITPLHRAISLEAVNSLLALHANVNATDSENITPLHAAVTRKQYDIVERLLKVGAKVNVITKNGDTPLSFAKTKKMAELLLSYKADVNGITSSSSTSTPLHAASFYGRKEITELLIKHGANINSQDTNGDTPLHRAAFAYSKNSIEAVRILIKRGADINAKNNFGKHPLDMSKNSDIRELIVANGGLSGK